MTAAVAVFHYSDENWTKLIGKFWTVLWQFYIERKMDISYYPPSLSLSLSFSLCHDLLFPLCISCFLLLFESLSLPMTYLSSSKHLKGRFPSNSIHEFGKPLLWLPTYLYTCEKVNNEAYSSFINTYLINIKNGHN